MLHVFLLGAAVYAQSPQIRRIDVNCVLDSTGCAHITEVWDVCVASGTEWYLVRTNLGEIELKNLAVKEGGTVFQVLQGWDVKCYNSPEEREMRPEQCAGRKALGLKKFLLDFTLIKERVSYEVVLWKQYLVFGALFGVADKVAEELRA